MQATGSSRRGGVLFPNAYAWFVFVSSMDLMLTFLVLHNGWREANPLAGWVWNRGGLPGLIAFKFAAVVLVIGVCEFVGRDPRRWATARAVAYGAVALGAIPTLWTLPQLLLHGPGE